MQTLRTTETELKDALAALIASTKRKKRKLTPLQMAEKIEIATRGLGSLPKVAEAVGLSYEMVRQIYSVVKCSDAVKRLVRESKVTSLDALHRLSKLPKSDQIVVARALTSGRISTDDVRAVVSLRKELPGTPIGKVISRIEESRNIRQYVAYFSLPSELIDAKEVRGGLEKVLRKGNIISVTVRGTIGEVVINAEGKVRLEEAAKQEGITKRQLLEELVCKGVK
jgi:hypothetical protein